VRRINMRFGGFAVEGIDVISYRLLVPLYHGWIIDVPIKKHDYKQRREILLA